MLQASQGYTWQGVLEFLYHEHQNVSQKQNLWCVERNTLKQRIKELEGRLTAAETINNDLKMKNGMLEFCIRELRTNHKMEKCPHQMDMPKIPERRPKPNKAQINKILCSLGINSVLEEIQKDLKEKAPESSLKLDLAKIEKKDKMQTEIKEKTFNYKEVATLTGHQDGVRDVCFLPDKNYLVSVSEDHTMKVWSTSQGPKDKCVSTIREHKGPIFTVIEGDGYIFTGGMEGIIRCWDLPKNPKQLNSPKSLVAKWGNSSDDKYEPIWQMAYSETNKFIFSTSSQIAIRSYELNFGETVTAKLKSTFNYHPRESGRLEEDDIPTAICLYRNSLIAGYVNSHCLVKFDIETKKVSSQIQFPSEEPISTNKIISHNGVLLGAFQDSMVRVFDDKKMLKSVQAHSDVVMSISAVHNSSYFFSCGQDGLVKLWDMRMYQEVQSFNAHNKKYDESCHCVATSKGNNMLASGGADAIIKLYAPS